MRVDIQPQWQKLADWYWDTLEGRTFHNRGMSIWEMLEHEYGAQKGFTFAEASGSQKWVHFPDSKTYTAFLLRWS